MDADKRRLLRGNHCHWYRFIRKIVGVAQPQEDIGQALVTYPLRTGQA